MSFNGLTCTQSNTLRQKAKKIRMSTEQMNYALAIGMFGCLMLMFIALSSFI